MVLSNLKFNWGFKLLSYSLKKPQITFLSVELQTLTRFIKVIKFISDSNLGGDPAWICQTGLLNFWGSCSEWYFFKKDEYSSTLFGIISKNNFFADCGLWWFQVLTLKTKSWLFVGYARKGIVQACLKRKSVKIPQKVDP